MTDYQSEGVGEPVPRSDITPAAESHFPRLEAKIHDNHHSCLLSLGTSHQSFIVLLTLSRRPYITPALFYTTTMTKVLKFLKDIRVELLDERSDDPSIFTGIGRMVNSLLGVDDDTTIVRPVSPNNNKRRLQKVVKKSPTTTTAGEELIAPERDWLEEAIASAPLGPLSEAEEESAEEEDNDDDDDEITVLPQLEEPSQPSIVDSDIVVPGDNGVEPPLVH